MKYLSLIVFLLASISLSAQTECKVDGLPCYEHYRIEMQTETDNRPQKWKAYESKLVEVYQSQISHHTWGKALPKDQSLMISVIVLTGPDRPFTVLEKYVYSWGGVFYFKDFMALSETKYLELESVYRK